MPLYILFLIGASLISTVKPQPLDFPQVEQAYERDCSERQGHADECHGLDGLDLSANEIQDKSKGSMPDYSLEDINGFFLELDIDYLHAWDCKDSFFRYIGSFQGKQYVFIYSVEDKCDGGNSMGIVIDAETEQVVCNISDSDFYCKAL